jgi:hypothetical protein
VYSYYLLANNATLVKALLFIVDINSRQKAQAA